MPLVTTRASVAYGAGFGKVLGSSVAVDNGVMFPLGMVQVGSGGSSSITFSSIPATYTHLQIRMLTASSNPSASMTMNFNSDNSSANYRNHSTFGTGSTTFSNTDGNAEYIGMQGSAMTTGPGVQIIDILDYKNTNKYTTSRWLSGYDANGSGYVFYGSSLWMNTAAVNQIVIARNTSGFFQYSQFALYGIKGA